MNPSWSDGYVTELTYISPPQMQMGPARLRMTCGLNGMRPPNVDEGFDYCELGCGFGLTTALLAAAYPQGRFTGTDFNPSHIAFARHHTAELGIDNVSFYDASFESFNSFDLPRFDFIALHGVWSWVSEKQREHILTFIDTHLKPGGVAYVSYNAKPGRLRYDPIKKFLSDLTPPSLPMDQRIREGLKLLEYIAKKPAGCFESIPQMDKMVEHFKTSEPQYLAHEFFNENWDSFYCIDVFNQLEQARLTFAGSTDMLSLLGAHTIEPEFRELYYGLPFFQHRQLCWDMFMNTNFRRDVFIRGDAPVTLARRREIFSTLRVGRAPFHKEFETSYTGPQGSFRLDSSTIFRRIYDMVSDKAMSLDRIADEFAGAPIDAILDSLVALLVSKQLVEFAEPSPEGDARAASSGQSPRLAPCNRRALDLGISRDEETRLVSKRLGSSLLFKIDEMYMLDAYLRGTDVEKGSREIARAMTARGVVLTSEEGEIEEKGAIREEMRKRYALWLETAEPEMWRLGFFE